MIWQDYAIMAIQFSFALALLPAVFGKEKPDRWACLMTSVLLYVMAFVMATLALKLASLSSFVVGTVWVILLVQRRSV